MEAKTNNKNGQLKTNQIVGRGRVGELDVLELNLAREAFRFLACKKKKF